MLKLRKTAACILALLSMAVSVSAANIPEPNEVIKGQSGELQTIQKVYVLPKTESSDIIPTEEFTEDKTKYAFTELLTEDNTKEDVKEHIEKISIHTGSANTQTVISQFEPTMEISTEDGYAGTLEFDYIPLRRSLCLYRNMLHEQYILPPSHARQCYHLPLISN